jgi:hypothetical protein
LAVSFPTLRWSAWTIASRSDSAAEPALGVATGDVRVRLLSSVFHTPAGALPPNPVRMRLRTNAFDPLPQGRHRTIRSRSFALRHGSCLLPLKLPSYLRRTTPFSVPPAIRILLRLRGHRRLPGASQSDHSIRDDSLPFSPSGCETGTFRRLFVRPKPSGTESPHWLTVATIGLYRLCSPTRSETTDPEASLGSRLVSPIRATCCSRHGSIPLTS